MRNSGAGVEKREPSYSEQYVGSSENWKQNSYMIQ